eukprot:jgi/Astpho2/995/Aster-00822
MSPGGLLKDFIPSAQVPLVTVQAFAPSSITSAAAGGGIPSGLAARQQLVEQPLLSIVWQQLRGKKRSTIDVGLKASKPITPGQRGRIITSRKDLWKGKPFKALTKGLPRTGGRNHSGSITSWHRGGRHKRLYRFIDVKRAISQDVSEVATVQRIEYDPNRSARIALLQHTRQGLPGPSSPAGTSAAPAPPIPVPGVRHSYILAPQSLAPGDVVRSGLEVPIRPGNSLPLHAMPTGTSVHNIELQPGSGGRLVRAAGTSAQLVSKGGQPPGMTSSSVHAKMPPHRHAAGADGYAILRLPSGEQKAVLLNCMATIGALSNPQNKNTVIGKAGAARWLGRRPITRGMAMNPVDHPHGGGRGKSKGRISQSPWGVPTKGYRTRKTTLTDHTIRLSRHLAKRTRR